MKPIILACALVAAAAMPAIANDYYYDAPYSGPYVGDGYDEWHPEFRSREARYRHDRHGYYDRYYDDDDYDYRSVKRRHYKRKYRGGDYEEEFWVGNCKIEREWDDDGSFEQEVDCD